MITVLRWRTLLLLAMLTLAALLAGLALALLSFTPALAEPPPTVEPPDWMDECALCPRWFTDLTPQALQTDPAGVIHVVYGGDGLYHAWTGPTGWTSEVADPTRSAGRFAALAIDPSGGLHAVYYDAVNHVLRYAAKQGETWRTEPIVAIAQDPAAAPENMYPTIAVDAAGQPRVAFYRPTSGNLAFAERGPTGWQVTTVDLGGGGVFLGGTGRYASLALDSTAHAHIAYADSTNWRLRYAVQTDTGWQLETVAPLGRETWWLGRHAALALDGADQPHIVTQVDGPPPARVLYLVKQGGAWHTEELPGACTQMQLGGLEATISDCGTHAAVRVGADGRVQVVYTYAYRTYVGAAIREGTRLRYLVRTAGAWQASELDADGSQSLLALNGVGQPVVAGIGGGRLTAYRLPDQAGQPWPGTAIDVSGDPGPQTAVAVDQAGQVHIAAMDVTQPALAYAVKTGNGWQPQQTPTVIGPAWTPIKVSLDPAGRPQLLYEQQVVYSVLGPYNGQVTHAWWNGASWQQDAHDNVPVTGTGLAVDLAGRSHLAYAGTQGLYYVVGALSSPAVQIEAGPQTWGKWPPGLAFLDADLAVDAQGRPQLAYWNAWDSAVRYATLRAGAWVTQTVAAGVQAGTPADSTVALALGPGGVPQIAFAAEGYGVALARLVGSRWQVNYLAADPPGGQPDLAVDATGAAHVSYYDRDNGSLVYVRVEAGGSAMTRVVAAGGYAGDGASIALDGAGRPHIAYYDALGHDVRHAYVPFAVNDTAYLPAVRK